MSLKPGTAPAGDAERRLLAALAEHYGGGEFSAKAAAVDLDPALWDAVGIASPAPAAVGRWLRGRKERGAALASRPNRDGVALWSLRGFSAPIPRDPALAEAAPAPAVSREPPEKPPIAAPQALASRPWWSVAPPAPGGAAERRAGASWWADLGGVAP